MSSNSKSTPMSVSQQPKKRIAKRPRRRACFFFVTCFSGPYAQFGIFSIWFAEMSVYENGIKKISTKSRTQNQEQQQENLLWWKWLACLLVIFSRNGRQRILKKHEANNRRGTTTNQGPTFSFLTGILIFPF